MVDAVEVTPKWNRRKDARPGEIIEAALDVFVECGFAAAKLDDVAKRAGIVKGTLYRYFSNKEDLFRAVVQKAIASNLNVIEQAAMEYHGSLKEIVPLLLVRASSHFGDKRIPALARMVISESQAFPDLASIWHDNVVARLLSLLTGLIAEGQARGEIRSGAPEIHAFSIVGPLVTALLFREVFGSSRPQLQSLNALALQHSDTVLRGLLIAV